MLRRFKHGDVIVCATTACLLLLCHKLYAQATAFRAARELLHQESGDLDTERRDGMGIMPLGASPSLPAAGSGEVSGRRITQDGRRGLRGKTVPFRHEEPVSRDA